MRKWVVGTVVAVVAALFGMPAAAIASPPDRAVHPTYAYNSPEYDAPGNDAVPERAPPARGLDFIAQDAVGQGPRGVAASIEAVEARATTANAFLGSLVRAARATTTTGSQVREPDQDLSSSRRPGVAAKAVPNEGISVIRNAADKVYVGQSGNITSRLGQHVSTGKFTQAEVDAAERFEVLGGKTAREIQEQLKLDSFGGRDASGVLNKVNPIGDRRLSLMPPGYVRP